MKLEWTDSAIKDMILIRDHISKDSKINADKVFLKIINLVEEIISFPEKGRIIPEIKKESCKEIFVYSYRIMYKITGDVIYIFAVIHMARDFKPKDL